MKFESVVLLLCMCIIMTGCGYALPIPPIAEETTTVVVGIRG